MAPKPKDKAQPKTAPRIASSTSELEPTQRPIPSNTRGEKELEDYNASRPLQNLFTTKGWSGLKADQRTAYSNAVILESKAYQAWESTQQKDFTTLCDKLGIPRPLPPPQGLDIDRQGRPIATYTLEEYAAWQRDQKTLEREKELSWLFRIKVSRSRRIASNELARSFTDTDIKEEKHRRAKIAAMETAKKVGRYAGDPSWDDITPIAQDDGTSPLAAIAYTEEYSEAISYLRGIMVEGEHSARVLSLTEHIISLNPAHYTVWLYRAKTLFALNSSISEELQWVNEVALDNQKNYQIWHHRQILINHIYPSLKSRQEIVVLAREETEFMTRMFEEDSKNYHVWSYRQFLVRKFEVFPSQTEGEEGLSEVDCIDTLLETDVRNNSAWSHRFFLIFSDPGVCTSESKSTSADPRLPLSLLQQEIEYSKRAILRAPNNQSPWNYLRGVLRKGSISLKELESFATGFVKLGVGEGQEEIKSVCALDFLADCWVETGEGKKADLALKLLGDKYDRIRKNYWEWRRTDLQVV